MMRPLFTGSLSATAFIKKLIEKQHALCQKFKDQLFSYLYCTYTCVRDTIGKDRTIKACNLHIYKSIGFQLYYL
jgi:hypothetical protein